MSNKLFRDIGLLAVFCTVLMSARGQQLDQTTLAELSICAETLAVSGVTVQAVDPLLLEVARQADLLSLQSSRDAWIAAIDTRNLAAVRLSTASDHFSQYREELQVAGQHVSQALTEYKTTVIQIRQTAAEAVLDQNQRQLLALVQRPSVQGLPLEYRTLDWTSEALESLQAAFEHRLIHGVGCPVLDAAEQEVAVHLARQRLATLAPLLAARLSQLPAD